MYNMNIKNENFATALDWLVQNKGIDGQKGLAEATGISANTISRIMTGKVQPSDATLRILAEKYGFNMEWLRGRTGQPMFIDIDRREYTNTHESPLVDVEFYHDALKLNAKVIEDMRKDLEYFKSLVLDKDSTIQENHEQVLTMRTQLVSLQTELDHIKNTLAAVRKNYDRQVDDLAQRDATIKLLQAQLARYSSGTTFPQGVAEDRTPITPDK